MKTYEIYTKYVDGAYTTEPVCVKTFTDEWDAYDFIENFANTQGKTAKAFFIQSYDKFLRGRADFFGIGAKMFCKVREI